MPLILLVAPAAFALGALVVYLAPERVRRRSVRWRQAVAAVAAIAAVFAPAEPTGLRAWDALLRAAFAAGLVLLAARARPKPVLLTAALLVAPALGEALPMALGAGGAGVALATALTVRRQGPLLTSLVGLLAGQAALRLPLEAFHGASSLAAVVALAPLAWSGYRNLRSGHRRRLEVGVLAVAGATLFIGLLSGVGVLLARGDLQAGVDASRAGLDAGRAAETEDASRNFSAAAQSFAGARDALEAAWVTPGRLVPGLGQNLRLLVGASRAGAELAITASESAGVAEAESIRVENGRLDLDRVRELEAPLEASTMAVERALDELDDAESDWILWPLASRFDRQRGDLERAEREAETALLAVRVLPGLLGGDGPRRYFLAVQQPAELRGSGGIIGNYGELTAVDGDLEVAKFGRDGELNEAATENNATLDGAPPDYVARYGRFTPERLWQNVSMSPHFPHVAETIRVLYPRSGGQQVDGVVSVTPRALASLLRITGPLTVAPWPVPITAANAEQILHVDQYVELEGQVRVDFLGDVAETITRRLTTGNLPPPPQLARLLSPAVRAGDLQLHSYDADEQRLFTRLGAGGTLAAENRADVLALITQNAGGNKLDTFLRRTVSMEAGPTSSRVDIDLANGSPASGVPEILNGSFVGDPPGTNRLYLSLHSSRPLRRAALDGLALAMESEREAGLNVYSAFIVIPPGGERRVSIELGAGRGGAPASFELHHQPTVIPDRVEVRLEGRQAVRRELKGDLVLSG